jgi:hypothetical protein
VAIQAPQKNKRLSGNDRDTLTSYARKRIEETQDRSALDAAYERAADAVHAALVARYPQKDMRVLAKYDAATQDECVYVSRGHYDYDRFCFRDGDARIPLRPTGTGCNSRNAFLLEGDSRAAYDAYKDATKTYEAAVKQRLSDFSALIAGSNTFNEVASVWPDAENLRLSIVGTASALMILSDDVVARLRADPANTLMAEAA